VITTRILRTVLLVVVLAVLVLAAVEVRWSMVERSRARRIARAAAGVALARLSADHDSLAARQDAEASARDAGAQLVAFTVLGTGGVRVTVSDHSKSYLLRRLPPTKTITEITVTETASA
jgi:Flp pilus assembly protein TadG